MDRKPYRKLLEANPRYKEELMTLKPHVVFALAPFLGWASPDSFHDMIVCCLVVEQTTPRSRFEATVRERIKEMLKKKRREKYTLYTPIATYPLISAMETVMYQFLRGWILQVGTNGPGDAVTCQKSR